MGAIASLVFVLMVSFFVIRTATAALTLTGLSRDLARFQSISAFTGVGFTTAESEHMLNHPVRRRVVMVLMIVGNVGIITAASTLVLTFSNAEGAQDSMQRALWLVVGLVLLALLLFNRRVDVRLHRMLRTMLRRSGHIDVQDYVEMLHLGGEFGVAEFVVHGEHWLTGRRLNESALSHEGVTVLGIQRSSGKYIGVPRGETLIQPGDGLTVYGRVEAIQDLGERHRDPEGDALHQKAVLATRHERAEQAWTDHRLRVHEESAQPREAPAGEPSP